LRSSPSLSVSNQGGIGHAAGSGHSDSTGVGSQHGTGGHHAPNPTARTAPKNTATSSTAAQGPAVAARLASASPASGAPGQSVAVRGTGLFSSNGQILAYFDGRDAPTSCATQTSCTVIVPDLGTVPSTVYLTVVTSSGRSNALSFAYK
jgi:IPT/TIG domain